MQNTELTEIATATSGRNRHITIYSDGGWITSLRNHERGTSVISYGDIREGQPYWVRDGQNGIGKEAILKLYRAAGLL
jgi:hypothetical protein